MKIFVSGGSGLGKTTFVQQLSKELGLPLKNEVIRSLYNSDPNFINYNFYERQAKILEAYIELHQSDESFISDRSILDIILWTNVHGEFTYDPMELLKVVDDKSIIIVTPTPTLEYYSKIQDNFTKDELRRVSYRDLYTASDEYTQTPEFIKAIHGTTKSLESMMKECLVNSDVTYFFPIKNKVNFFDWQAQSSAMINYVIENFNYCC